MGEQNLELVKPNDAKKTNVESLWLKWANLVFPEEIDNRMKTLEKYDLSKLMQNLYVMN